MSFENIVNPFRMEGDKLTGYYPPGFASDTVTVPNGVRVIGKEVFQGQFALKKVILPESVTYIESDAFSGCRGLETVVMKGEVTEILKFAFYGCTALKDITLPKSLTYIGTRAFGDCKSLKEIRIPAAVKQTGSSLFIGCPDIRIYTYGSTRGWDDGWNVHGVIPGGFLKKEQILYLRWQSLSQQYEEYLRGVALYNQSSTEAYRPLLVAAEAGVVEAYWYVAQCYLMGKGVAQSAETALCYLQKMPCSLRAMHPFDVSMAVAYLNVDTPQALQSAVFHFQAVLNDSDIFPTQRESFAYPRLGSCYYRLNQFSEALRYFELAVRHGSTDCFMILSDMYAKGKGTAPSPERAAYWREREAVRTNNAEDYYRASQLYEQAGTEAALQEAFRLCTCAAERGHALAMLDLIEKHQKGIGTAPSYSMAEQWAKAAAAGGNQNAMLYLAAWYVDKKHPLYDPAKALPWVEKLVAMGDDKLKDLLNSLRRVDAWAYAKEDYAAFQNYLYGFHGCERDEAKGLEHLKRAADAEYPHALYQMGLIYFRGWYGYPKDKEQAVRLWKRAAEFGHDKAKIQLRQLEDIRRKQENRLRDAAAKQAHARKKNELQAEVPAPVEAVELQPEAPAPTPAEVPQAQEDASPVIESKAPCEPTREEVWQQRYRRAQQQLYGLDGEEFQPAAAFETFTALVGEGCVEANVMLGHCFDRGWGIDIDKARAFQCYKAAADCGVADAFYHLSLYHSLGITVTKNADVAKQMLLRAAELGSCFAISNMVMNYCNGFDGFQKDVEQARAWAEKLIAPAESGDVQAQYKLGDCYRLCSLKLQPPARAEAEREARRWLGVAAERGYGDALFSLAYMHEAGSCGAAVDLQKAARYYEMAAIRQNVIARTRFANCCYHGRGVPLDYARAATLYAQGSTAEDKAMLAECYLLGRGVPQDSRTAIARFNELLSAFCPGAIRGRINYNMGYCCENGVGVIKNLAKAKEYYENAAGNGYVEALVLVADACFEGRFPFEKDHEKAKKYYTKAANAGNAHAKSRLDVLG